MVALAIVGGVVLVTATVVGVVTIVHYTTNGTTKKGRRK